MAGVLLALSLLSLCISVQEELALREVRRAHPEIISLHTAPFLPGFRALLLIGAAWGIYRLTFSSWIWSCAAVMLTLSVYQVAYICRVFTWGPATMISGKEWTGVYEFLKSSDSPYMFRDIDFAIIGFGIVILIAQLTTLTMVVIRERKAARRIIFLTLLLFFSALMIRSYQQWPTRTELLERRTPLPVNSAS